MKPTSAFVCLLVAGSLHAQNPTITSVQNESDSNSLCPGGVPFVKGTNLGNASAKVTVGANEAYVFNASGGTSLQIQLPVNAPLGATTLTAGSSAPFNITLVQYCPGPPSNSVNGVAYVYALHGSSGLPVTAAFPAIPDELVDITVTGLGPTTPLYSTGTAPPDASANTNAKPSVTIGGQPANVANSFLAPGNPASTLWSPERRPRSPAATKTLRSASAG